MPARTTAALGPRTIHRQIVEALALRIVSRRVGPGELMPTEGVLCVEFGISRTILREAMKFLAAKGMVEIRPKIGTRVLPPERWNLLDADVVAWRAEMGPDDRLVRDLVDLRNLIEPAAAERAAQRARPEHVAAMEEALMRMEAAVRPDGDMRDYVVADLDFHRGLLNACDNQLLAQLASPIGAVLKVSFAMSTRRSENAARSVPLHREIVEGIKAGDAARARAAIETIIGNAAAEIEENYGKPAAKPRAARRAAR